MSRLLPITGSGNHILPITRPNDYLLNTNYYLLKTKKHEQRKTRAGQKPLLPDRSQQNTDRRFTQHQPPHPVLLDTAEQLGAPQKERRHDAIHHSGEVLHDHG